MPSTDDVSQVLTVGRSDRSAEPKLRELVPATSSTLSPIEEA